MKSPLRVGNVVIRERFCLMDSVDFYNNFTNAYLLVDKGVMIIYIPQEEGYEDVIYQSCSLTSCV